MAEATAPDEIDKIKETIFTDEGVDVKNLEGQLIGAESEKSIDGGVTLDGGADGKDSGIKFGVESPPEPVNQNRKKKKKNKKKRNNGNAGQLSARSSETHEDSPNVASTGSIVDEHEGSHLLEDSSHSIEESVPETCGIVTELESVEELETSGEVSVTATVVEEPVLAQGLESLEETPKEEKLTAIAVEESAIPQGFGSEESVAQNEEMITTICIEEPGLSHGFSQESGTPKEELVTSIDVEEPVLPHEFSQESVTPKEELVTSIGVEEPVLPHGFSQESVTPKEELVISIGVEEPVLKQGTETAEESVTPNEEPVTAVEIEQPALLQVLESTEESETLMDKPITATDIEKPIVAEELGVTPVENSIELTSEDPGLNGTGSNSELGITNQPSLNVIFYSDGSGHAPSQGDLTNRLTASEAALKEELDAALESEFTPKQNSANNNDAKEDPQAPQAQQSEDAIIPEAFPDPGTSGTHDEEATSFRDQGPTLNIFKPSFVVGSPSDFNLAQIDEELLEPDDILNNNYIRAADSQDFENKWNNDFYLSSESKDALRIPAVPNPSLDNIANSTPEISESIEGLPEVPVPPLPDFGVAASTFMADRASWKKNSPEFVAATKKSVDDVLDIASSQIEVILARVDDFIMGGVPCDDLSETVKALGVEEEEESTTETDADTGSMNNLLRFDEESDVSLYPVNFSKLTPDEPGYLSANGTTFKLEDAHGVVPQISEGFQVTEKSPFEIEESDLEIVEHVATEIFETKSDPDVPPQLSDLAETNPFRSVEEAAPAAAPTAADPNILEMAALFPSPPSDRDFFWEEPYKYHSSFEQDYLKLTSGNFHLNYEPASRADPEIEEINSFQSSESKVGTGTLDQALAHKSKETFTGNLVEDWREIPIYNSSEESINSETATNSLSTQKHAEPVLVRKGTPAAEVPSIPYELLKEDYDKTNTASKNKCFSVRRAFPCISGAEGLAPPPVYGPEREKRTIAGTIRNLKTGSLKRFQTLTRRN